jgi:trehalose/maltose hydrolase-like predicted phosphorylase
MQRAVRFAVYHLTSAANPEDDRVSIGARALTGDAYIGHVFWDTEIYLLPFYTAVWPEAARALLMYRFHTLPGARAKAAHFGFKGALYAWESADTGEETTPERVVGADGKLVDILTGRMEHHISADVAYAVWQYWHFTGDDDFFLRAGAEILLDTARFWASRAVTEADGKRHIRHVIGPDEYHEDVDDNAFTNVMARWNIARRLGAGECFADFERNNFKCLGGQRATAQLADNQCDPRQCAKWQRSDEQCTERQCVDQ